MHGLPVAVYLFTSLAACLPPCRSFALIRVSGNTIMDDIDHYEPSDSEDDYSENERILLDRTRKIGRKDDESEEEVYGLQSSEDGSDHDDVNIDSDLEGGGDGDLPDVKAWGRDKRAYYSTDYVDQDYGGFDGKDAVAAGYEEQEARDIQKRLAEQLDDEDFSLEIFTKKPESKDTEKEEEFILTDPTKLSKRQKLELFEKDSPEFFGLTEDFKEKMTEVKNRLSPILDLFKDDKYKTVPAIKYVKTKNEIILNYCANIMFYLLLKARRMPVQSHPVLRRLYQYRQLLKQLEPIDEEVMDPQIDKILTMMQEGKDVLALVAGSNHSDRTSSKKKGQKKLLKLLTKQNKENGELEMQVSQPPTKKAKLKDDFADEELEEYSDPQESAEGDKAANDDTGELDAEGKRAITYQMAKNRGLTPYRRKELRNPRVKHRMKYRKAKIHRKGQVREPRYEIQRYGGEISGIKSSVTKSIKIK